MKTSVHLISMPWAAPLMTPVQLGCLKAYVDEVFEKNVPVRTYAPFLSIPLRYRGGAFIDFYRQMGSYAEIPYLLLYAQSFGFPGAPSRSVFGGSLRDVKALTRQVGALSVPLLAGLKRATVEYIEESIVPNLDAEAVNVIGFTLNYNQVYSSLYCARYLQQHHPNYRYLFVYGGMSITLPQTARIVKELDVGGLGIIGEGEKKLEWIMRKCLESAGMDGLEDAIASVSGIYKLRDGADLYDRRKENFETQFKSIDSLPFPDYSDYFAELREGCEDDFVYRETKSHVELLLEGTRGCFAKCDFCGLNFTWDGFRKKAPSIVAHQSLRIVKEYDQPRIVFADNVCDTWAEDYARVLIDSRVLCDAFMEMRAHHPETFWTMLALAGVIRMQIGVEAISPHLLGNMAKGTKVIQNLKTQKYLRELGIQSASNLITHHPRSNVEDAKETARIVELIPHFQAFEPNPFYLSMGSPLYNKLSIEEKRELEVARVVSLPAHLDWVKPYIVDFCFEAPPSLRISDEVRAAWDEFVTWYNVHRWEATTTEATLTQTRLDADTLRIDDTRFGRVARHILAGDVAKIYGVCHGGLTLQRIERETKLGPDVVRQHVADLVERKLILRTDDSYLSLALRPRDELINNYMAVERARSTRSAADAGSAATTTETAEATPQPAPKRKLELV
ncbi:MAG: radical SAM protein [Polyangiaceae bacterium]